jgi:hypothetical protein
MSLSIQNRRGTARHPTFNGSRIPLSTTVTWNFCFHRAFPILLYCRSLFGAGHWTVWEHVWASRITCSRTYRADINLELVVIDWVNDDSAALGDIWRDLRDSQWILRNREISSQAEATPTPRRRLRYSRGSSSSSPGPFSHFHQSFNMTEAFPKELWPTLSPRWSHSPLLTAVFIAISRLARAISPRRCKDYWHNHSAAF